MALRSAYVDHAVSGGGKASAANGGDWNPLLLTANPGRGLIESRSDEGPASVDKEGNAECEHDDFGTDHSVSRVKLFNVGP